jgi:hypothetical protein
VVIETRLNVTWLVEALIHELLDTRLRAGPRERGHEGVPFRLDFGIGWEISLVGETFGRCDRLLVEPSSSPSGKARSI